MSRSEKKSSGRREPAVTGISREESEVDDGASSTPIRGAAFPRGLRIKKREEFQHAFKDGRVAADGVLVMHAVRAEQGGPTRLGISIARRVGNAPERNYWKRLIREAFRTQRGTLPDGLLVIVRPKKGATPGFVAISKSMSALMRRLSKKLN